MWVKGKFYRFILIKKLNTIFLTFFLYFSIFNPVHANFQDKLIDKYKTINTLHFDFTQKIGEKVEFGDCYIKYPLFMKCEYPKKMKSIIANGKRFAVIKRKYKKIYYYALKNTPLFYLLKKENILNLVKNYEPLTIDQNIVTYELIENNSNKLKIFFNKNTQELLGWKTTDSYSNEVSFLIRNIEINIPIEDKIFKIPRETDL